ncbi:hypothetical protein BGZ60DRAFT_164463 [Tricladium varicosporioides]|nr:hypothetical protein BGZ60DRAFT_164463 [Hymenoscyphus varicosporioides]
MPFYNIEHSIPLSPSQKSSLAKQITNLHSIKFNAPSLFVNIKFSPLDSSSATLIDPNFFVGGKPKAGLNYIWAHVRGGGGRSQEHFDKLAESVEEIWNDVTGEKGTLQAVFIVPGIVARERGLRIPPAGEEGKWMEESWDEFENRALEGDEDFKGLVDEVKERPELRGKGK